MTATDLDQALTRLAADIEPPRVPLADDLARGRRRLLRRRLAVAGAAAVTVGVIGGAALLGQGTQQSMPDPVDRTPDAEQTEAAEPNPATRPLPPIDGRTTNGEVLTHWNDVLAEHLDPGREHLQPYSQRTADAQSSGGGYLGSKYGWANPGEDGLGMLQVGVARSRAASWESPCEAGQYDLTCRDATGPGGESARVGEADSVTVVELQQENGAFVTLTLDLLLGNSSETPLSGTDVTTDELLEAAADARLALPATPPTPDIDDTAFGRVARELASQGRWQVDGWAVPGGGLRFTGVVRDGGRQVAVVDADAYPTSAGYGLPRGCPQQLVRCERRVIDGDEVFLGWDDQTHFPDTQVVYAGPDNVVRVRWQRSGDAGADPDLGRLVDFVADPRWQS